MFTAKIYFKKRAIYQRRVSDEKLCDLNYDFVMNCSRPKCKVRNKGTGMFERWVVGWHANGWRRQMLWRLDVTDQFWGI